MPIAPRAGAWRLARRRSVLLCGRVHVGVVRVELPLVLPVPVVVPHAAPVVPSDDAASDDEAVEARRALQEDLVDAGRVEEAEKPIEVVHAVPVVLAPVLDPRRLVVAHGGNRRGARRTLPR